MKLGKDLDSEEFEELYVVETHTAGFQDYLNSRRQRSDKFFTHPPPKVLDICQVPIATRAEKRGTELSQ